MTALRRILTLSLVFLIAACTVPAQTTTVIERGPISAEMLLENSPLAQGHDLPDLSKIDMLELSPEMIEFLDDFVNPSHGQTGRLERLLYAIMGSGTFDLVYDDFTRTAKDTFRDQRGNCLSFTNLFVAMARYVNLDAQYQEVMIPPSWSQEGGSFIFSQHINVHVDTGVGLGGADQIIDFNMYDYRSSYEREIISDNRARAHYFNNIGVEHMLDGDTPLAFANFRESLREDSAFSPAWANLGILYRREGYENYAETAYLKAINVNLTNMVAMSNLASLYEQQGRTEEAEQYRDRVRSHRMQNPYFRYQMARTAFEEGDYDGSIEHLRYALRKKDDDDQFYSLMSLSYLMKGDRKAAQEWMKQAEDVAASESDKQRYHNKFDMMIRNGAESG
jgi:Flp pilus assembly protein TadD